MKPAKKETEPAWISIEALSSSALFKSASREHRKVIILSALVMLIATIAGLVGIEYQAQFLSVMKPSDHTQSARSEVVNLFILFSIFQVLYEISQYAKRGLQNRLAVFMAESIKLKILEKMLRFNTSEINEINQGEANQLFTSDASQLASVWAEGLLAFITTLTLALGVSLVIFIKVGWPGFIFLLSLFVLVYLATRFSSESAPLQRARALFSSKRLAEIQECIRSISVVKMLGLEPYFYSKVSHFNLSESDARLQATRIASKYIPFFASLRWLAWALVLLWIVIAPQENTAFTGEKNVSLIFSVNWYSTLLQDAFLMIGAYLNFIQLGSVSAKRLDSFFSTPSTEELARETEQPRSVEIQNANAVFRPGQTLLHLNETEFIYKSRPQVAALKLNQFELKMGCFIGVVGRIGAGKSTLIRALANEMEPQKGTLWRAQGLRAALVTQEPFLISSTLRDTIRFQFENQSKDDPTLQSLVTDAQFAIDFENLPQGWNTLVGERGLTLSGGQKMRMSLARAGYFEDAHVILLDDPLSSLDKATAIKVTEEMILGRWSTKTRVLVTHFIDALKHADRVIVLDQGELIDQGTHDELLQRCALYKEIHKKSQS